MSLVVVGANVSPFVRKVRAFLAEKGVEYEHEFVNPFDAPPDFRRLSPLGKIPVLRDGERVVNDSSVICQYLERRFPHPPLYPADDYDFARALWIEEYVDAGFQPVGAKVFQPRVLQGKLGGRPVDEEAVGKVIEQELPPYLDYLDGQVGGEDFLFGAHPTIADIAIATVFVNLRHAAVHVDERRWPALAAHVGRMHARPSFRTLIEEEAPVFSIDPVR